jgi:hypothetical protein
MAFLLPFLFIVGCLTLLSVMRHWLRLQNVSGRTQGAFSLFILLGALLGVGLSLKFEYPLGEDKRVTGAPLPVILQKLEANRWNAFPPPRPILAALVVANSAITATVIAGPLFLLLSLRRSPRPPAP